MLFVPCLVHASQDGCRVPRLGHPLLDDYLDIGRGPGPTEHGAGHCVRPEGVLLGRRQGRRWRSTESDVFVFIAAQRQPRRGATVVRIEDGEAGLSARTIKRRLATVAGLFEYLIVRGVVA